VSKNKGKKNSVHVPPVDPTLGNIRIFLDQARVCDLYHDYKLTALIDPRHPRAPFYQRLMVSFKQNQQEHIDLNGDSMGTYDPHPDDVSTGNDMDSKDKFKAGPPIKRKVPNPGGVCWSKEEAHGWDDRNNNPGSYAYDDYGQGYVSFSNNHFAHIDDKQHVALISSLCSLLSNVCYNYDTKQVSTVK
jgi:hypothetical protein